MFSLFRLVFIASRYTHTHRHVHTCCCCYCLHSAFAILWAVCVVVVVAALRLRLSAIKRRCCALLCAASDTAFHLCLLPLPPSLPLPLPSTPAFPTAFYHCLCLYLTPFAVTISVAIPVPILYPRASLRILVELLLKVQHWQRAWA